MASSKAPLPVIPLPGLRLEVLGNYLASLGLVRLLARKWPSVRIGWRDGVLQVVGGPSDLDELLDALLEIATKRQWTPYDGGWKDKQQESTDRKSARPLELWQSDADEEELELFAAHLVPRERVAFNPLLGTGGKAGRRQFRDGWRTAVDALAQTPNGVDSRKALQDWLEGRSVSWALSKLNGASWFSSANKLYNSGQSAYREEPLSPWAMALACEGLPFFAGSASRRLGVRGRAQAAFPFVCRAAAPTTEGEAGHDHGEIWAPIWERPMTLPEVRTLFQRGRAEVAGRGANTPAAFAAAIVQRGVDAGIAAFARFALGATTSAKTFEPRHQGTILVRPSATQPMEPIAAKSRSTTVERILELSQRLPEDRKVGNRWRFVGLRGPIEAGLLRVAAAPDDAAVLGELLDAVVSALDRVDRNASHRARRLFWRPVPIQALCLLFRDAQPGLEARLALGLVSAFPPERPFTLYRFGVEQRHEGFEHPESPPATWVFHPRTLPRVLADLVHRSLLDGEKRLARPDPLAVSAADLQQWLDGRVEEALLARWLGRLAVFDWRHIPNECRRLRDGRVEEDRVADGPLLLAGLLQPLFDTRPLYLPSGSGGDDLFSDANGARTAGAARAIAALIRTCQIAAALRMARSRYAMAKVPLLRTEVPWEVADPDRLLSALFFPMANDDRMALVERWLRPQRKKGNDRHA